MKDQLLNPNNLARRALLRGLGTTAGAALLASWGCSSRPRAEVGCAQLASKQLHWLVPFAPGGGFDIYSRLIEPFYQEKVGAQIVIENVPGAGGTVSANKLRQSKPDGATLGILNAPGLLAASMAGDTNAPDPAKDFTVLGRVVRNRLIWAAGTESGLKTIGDVFAEARKRPMLFAISDAGSTSFVSVIVTSSLLSLETECIAGHSGSRDCAMAVLRGEADLLAATFESVLDQIEAGDLTPILQISSERISPHSSLDGAPLLGGDSGLAAIRAAELGNDINSVKADALSLAVLLGAGLLIAAPPGLEEGLYRCLEEKLHEALTDPGLLAAAAEAKRSLDVARGDSARGEIEDAGAVAQRFTPLMRAAIAKLRT